MPKYTPTLEQAFQFRASRPISIVPGSPGYGDKLCRVIDAADPGAVPGGSTIFPVMTGCMTGPN